MPYQTLPNKASQQYPMHKVVRKLGSLLWCGERQAESLHRVTQLSCPARTCQKRPACWLTPAESLKSRDWHSSPPLLLGVEGLSQKIGGDYLQLMLWLMCGLTACVGGILGNGGGGGEGGGALESSQMEED